MERDALYWLNSDLDIGDCLAVSPAREIYPGFSLVEFLHYCALIGRELQSVEIFSVCYATIRIGGFHAQNLLLGVPLIPIIDSFCAWKPPILLL